MKLIRLLVNNYLRFFVLAIRARLGLSNKAFAPFDIKIYTKVLANVFFLRQLYRLIIPTKTTIKFT